MDDLKQTGRRHGMFDRYQVLGTQYQNSADELAWLIIAWETEIGSVEHYWVSKGEFFTVGMHIFYNNTDRTLIQPTGIATNIEPAEKQAISKAIAEWEKSLEVK
jgi:hypothetical protein